MDLVSSFMLWIGIDSHTSTFGGWSYRTLGEFFIQNSKLTTQETFKYGGTVKSRFQSYYELLDNSEKVYIANKLITIFEKNVQSPQRTEELFQLINDQITSLSCSESNSKVYADLKTLNMSELTNQSELKKSYIAMIKLYHPDMVEKLADEIKTLALNRTKEINAAYDNLRIVLSQRN